MTLGSALSICARNVRLIHHTLETAYVSSISAGDLHLDLNDRESTSGNWRLTNRGRDGGREVNSTDQLAASLSAVLRVAAAENAGTVTVRLTDRPTTLLVLPQHEWPCFQLDGNPDEG